MSLDNFDFNIECDCIVSIGATCRVAEALKRNNLRMFSSPFDWLTDYTIDHFYNYLLTKGKNLFSCIINIPEHDRETGKTFGVIDAKTKILSMHDFKKDVPFEVTYKDVLKKQYKRFKRMNNILKKTKTVCFVSNRKIKPEDFFEFGNKMNKKYKFKKIYFVNIRHDTEESFKFYTQNNIVFWEFAFNDIHKDGDMLETNPYYWKGNMEKWDSILQHVRLTNRINYNREKKTINLGLFKISYKTGT